MVAALLTERTRTMIVKLPRRHILAKSHFTAVGAQALAQEVLNCPSQVTIVDFSLVIDTEIQALRLLAALRRQLLPRHRELLVADLAGQAERCFRTNKFDKFLPTWRPRPMDGTGPSHSFRRAG
jgi:hypothetical protein